MAYGICRVEKVKATAVAAMQYHNDRMPGNHSNPNIDPARRRDNVELLEHGSYRDEVAARIEKYRKSDRKVRKDAVVLVEGVVTASPEFFEGKSREEVMAYFRDAFDFVKAEFGEQNMVHFTIHFDEVTPHAHFGATPIKDGSLSWKKFFDGRSALKGWQDRFFSRVSSRYGLERGEQDTGRTHKDAAQMRRDAEREAKAMEERAKEMGREVDESAERLEGLRREEVVLGEEVGELERIEGAGVVGLAMQQCKGEGAGERERRAEEEVRALRGRAAALEAERERAPERVRGLEREAGRARREVGGLERACRRLEEEVRGLLRRVWTWVADLPERVRDLARDLGAHEEELDWEVRGGAAAPVLEPVVVEERERADEEELG